MSERPSRDLRRFASAGRALDAVVQRVGRDTFELILIDEKGDWTPAVFGSEDEARAAAEALGATVYQGWTEDLSKRVGGRNAWASPDGKRRAL